MVFSQSFQSDLRIQNLLKIFVQSTKNLKIMTFAHQLTDVSVFAIVHRLHGSFFAQGVYGTELKLPEILESHRVISLFRSFLIRGNEKSRYHLISFHFFQIFLLRIKI